MANRKSAAAAARPARGATIIPFPCRRLTHSEAKATLTTTWSPEFKAGVDWAMHLVQWLQEQREAEGGMSR